MNKKSLLVLFIAIVIYTGCSKKIEIIIDNSNERYIIKKMDDKLIINLKSHYSKPVKVKITITDVTADYSDNPIYKKNFTLYSGSNIIIINMSDIGLTKFRVTIFHNNDIIDSRIIEYIPNSRE